MKPSYKQERVFSAKGGKLKEVSFAPSTQRIELTATDYRGLDFLVDFH